MPGERSSRPRLIVALRTSALVVALALATTRCFVCTSVCPNPADWCEGDTQFHCELRCSAPRELFDPPQVCSAETTQVDCAASGLETFGVEKTCHVLAVEGGPRGVCIDKPLTPCALEGASPDSLTARPIRCDADHVVSCVGVEGDSFVDTGLCSPPDRVCQETVGGVACVDGPRVSCDPTLFPVCRGSDLVSCVGEPDAGFSEATDRCADATNGLGITGSCAVDHEPVDGGAVAECVFVATDAGPADDAGPGDDAGPADDAGPGDPGPRDGG